MNIINAIINLVQNPAPYLATTKRGHNRANNAGDALEEYVKDLFSGTFGLSENTQLRLQKLACVFSYLGNNSNPPDAMLRGGDAIEVKKIESAGSALALNSSYPKQTLCASSPMLSKACRAAEEWTEKDIIYTVGAVDKHTNQLKQLCMVYGMDYCAADECYSRIKTTIKNGVEAIPGIEFAESRELGHINRIDPLGITYLRVRGMWGIENPWHVFEYVYTTDKTKNFNFMCIINTKKWQSFDNTDELIALCERIPALCIEDVQIKNPDNPARIRDAKLITFHV